MLWTQKQIGQWTRIGTRNKTMQLWSINLRQKREEYTMENNTGDYNKTIESATILGKMTKAFENYEGLKEDGIFNRLFK